MQEHKICFFNRSSIHYRKNIWLLMDRDLQCDFYFGDSRPGNIRSVPHEEFIHFKGVFHNVNFGRFYWQKGALKLLCSDYTDIITPADPLCLSSWLLILFAKLFHKNIYTWTHGAYGGEKGLRRLVIKWKIKHLKGCFLYGEYAKNILIKWGVPKSKLHVVYNSLNYDEQLPIRNSLVQSDLYQKHFGNNFPNIVFIGRLTKVKKLDQIIRAVAKLKKLGLGYNITFVGDGVERENLEKMSESLGIEANTWFYGACYDEKRNAELLYNADICISPGNVGLTAMHAMTFGCPVLSHNNFSMQMPEFEAIDVGKTGDFFQEDDIDSLVDTIIRWQTNSANRDIVRLDCYKIIDEKYNPHVQIETLKSTIFSN